MNWSQREEGKEEKRSGKTRVRLCSYVIEEDQRSMTEVGKVKETEREEMERK